MRIDLHTHSTKSDGTLSPAEVISAAVAAGLDVVALTDHDGFAGLEEASRAAERSQITLVPGVEVSCRFAGHGVHLLGYRPDLTHPGLLAELGRIIEGRSGRMPATVERLRDLGIEIDLADVEREASDAAALGRPHVADALVRLGVVASRDEAFDRYVGPGGPGFVDRYAAELEEMIGLIADAGGVSVIAHPWAGRYDSSALDEQAFASLRDRGLAGIEVDHQDHDGAVRADLRGIAERLDLVITGSSDFHGAGKTGFDLGCNTTDPAQYERLLAGVRT